jgi:hypothetical protein
MAAGEQVQGVLPLLPGQGRASEAPCPSHMREGGGPWAAASSHGGPVSAGQVVWQKSGVRKVTQASWQVFPRSRGTCEPASKGMYVS